jgi:carboxymethylenebutenolidase
MPRAPGDEEAALGALFDLHVRAEFVDRDIDETMATMAGGHGAEAVRQFYVDHFIGHWPADTRITPVSRTIGQGRVVDELLMSFTHDIAMDAFLPGVPPTGRPVEFVVVVIVGTEHGKVAFERIYWDQASVLVQIGLLDPHGLPVTGAAQAHKVIDPLLPSNQLMR